MSSGIKQLALFSVRDNGDLHGCFRRGNGREFQDRYEPLAPVVWPLAVATGIGAFGLRMVGKVEHLHAAAPNRLAAKHFMHGDCLAPDGAAPVQLLNRYL
jgi:hypothetical protein